MIKGEWLGNDFNLLLFDDRNKKFLSIFFDFSEA